MNKYMAKKMQSRLYRRQIQIQLQIKGHSSKTNVFSLQVVSHHHFQIVPPHLRLSLNQHLQPLHPFYVLQLTFSRS
jgi:hypothetical protein